MKVSLFGSNGFLATAIATFCNENGWFLAVYGRHEPRNYEYDQFNEFDPLFSELCYEALLDSDWIVYAIGAGIQSDKCDSASLVFLLNTTLPIDICNNLKRVGFRGAFISFGSYFEIGETNLIRPFTENDILRSVSGAPSDYVVSKRLLSTFVSSYHHDFKHWHFILPTLYGVGENPKRLIPYTINAMVNGVHPHFTAGDQVRQYIHVSEIPRLVHLSFESNLPSGIYNVQGCETLTVRDLVSSIYDYFGERLPLNCFASIQRVDELMPYLVLDGSKLNLSTGFKANVSIKDVFDDYHRTLLI